MSFKDVSNILKEKFNVTAVEIDLLDGLSNKVYKVTDANNQKYVFKILSYNPNEIFRLFERHAIKKSKANEIYIYDDLHHRLERYIEHQIVDKQTFIKEPMCIYQMYCLAKFNKCNTISSDRPNLFYIVENSKQKLTDALNANILKIDDWGLRNEIRAKLAVVNRVYEFYRLRCKEEPLVLSHNDCYYRNYLYSTQEQQLFLIDYEYAGYNPLGMDVLVLYQEYMCNYEVDSPPGPNVVYSDFPSDDTFRRLLRFFLYFYKYMDDLIELKHDKEFVKIVESDKRFSEISDVEVEAILGRFGYYGVMTQVFFFYWALYLFEIKGIDFDYVRFSKIKYEMLGFFLKRDGLDIKDFEKEVGV